MIDIENIIEESTNTTPNNIARYYYESTVDNHDQKILLLTYNETLNRITFFNPYLQGVVLSSQIDTIYEKINQILLYLGIQHIKTLNKNNEIWIEVPSGFKHLTKETQVYL